MNEEIRCPHCGAIADKNSNFCLECGRPIRQNKKIWFSLSIFLIVLIVIGIALWYFHGSLFGGNNISDSIGEAVQLSDPVEYRVINKTNLVPEPESAETSGSLKKGEYVLVDAIKTTGENEEQQWGRTENGWCLLSEGKTTNLEEVILSKSFNYPDRVPYSQVKPSPVYEESNRFKELPGQTADKEITPIQVLEDDYGTVWAKLSDNIWVLIKDESTVFYILAEEDQDEEVNTPVENSEDDRIEKVEQAQNEEWKLYPDYEENFDSSSSSMLFPDSDSRYLTEADISTLNLQELNYAKNEIYARRGREFKSKELQNYFLSKDWYIPSISPDQFNDSMFNKYELANVQLLSNAEHALNPAGYPLDS